MVLTKVIKTTKMKESESQLNMHFKMISVRSSLISHCMPQEIPTGLQLDHTLSLLGQNNNM